MPVRRRGLHHAELRGRQNIDPVLLPSAFPRQAVQDRQWHHVSSGRELGDILYIRHGGSVQSSISLLD